MPLSRKSTDQKRVCRHHDLHSRTIPLVLSCLFLLLSGCASNQSNPSLSISDRGQCVPADIPLMLAAQVDLDYVYDPDIRQQKKNETLLVERVCNLGLTTILLQAFADPDGNNVAEELYFPNRVLPMRRNLFAGTAKALKRCGLKVYAWMPMLAFALSPGQDDLQVQAIQTAGGKQAATSRNHRLSPFNQKAVTLIRKIYEDLAQSGPLDGILFNDDAVLSDYEDASADALAAYKKAGFPADITRIHDNKALMEQWSRFKTKALINLSRSLMATVHKYHPYARSGRNLYALPILQPTSEQWFAQSLPLFLQAYDYTFVLAMPFMEKAANNERWLVNLADRALAGTMHRASLVFELQSVNWWQRHKIATADIIAQATLLHQHGIISFAYYPDDFLQNHPEAESMRQLFARITNSWTRNSHD